MGKVEERQRGRANDNVKLKKWGKTGRNGQEKRQRGLRGTRRRKMHKRQYTARERRRKDEAGRGKKRGRHNRWQNEVREGRKG